MDLKTATVETTGTNRGQRFFRQQVVEYDTTRPVEENFIPAREGVPAQHRIFVRDTTNRFERQTGVTLRPELITRFLLREVT